MKKAITYYYIALSCVIGFRLIFGLFSYNEAITYNQKVHELKQEKAAVLQKKQQLQVAQSESYSLHSVANSESIASFVPITETHSLTHASTIAQNTLPEDN